MLKNALAAGLIMLCGSAAFGDYLADRKAATELVNAGKQEEALAAFQKIAAGADVSVAQKSDALEQAAMCAQRLKKSDEAMKLAQAIPSEPVSKTCQMRILFQNRQWATVTEQFKDEVFTGWPDETGAEAAQLRGQARAFLKDGKGAEADFKTAAQMYPDNFRKGAVYAAMGDNYTDNLKDDAQAIAAYMKAFENVSSPGSYISGSAIISTAAILRKQGKNDEAMQMLQKLDVTQMQGFWRASMLAALGQTLEAQGKKAEALARYNEVLAFQGAPDHIKKECEKRAEALKTP